MPISLGQQLAENIRVHREQTAAEIRAKEMARKARRSKVHDDLNDIHTLIVTKITDQIMSGNSSISFKLTAVAACGSARNIYDRVCLYNGNVLKATATEYFRDITDIIVDSINKLLEWGIVNGLKIKLTNHDDGMGMKSWSVIEATIDC